MNENDIEDISNLDLYEILNISNECSESKLKKSYKKLVLTYHPDRGGDSDAFELVNLAYTILKDSKMRKIYDKKRKDYLSSRDFNGLKYDKMDMPMNIPNTKDAAKKNFIELEKELNKKHNFDSSDVDVISTSELKKRMEKLQFSRNNFETDHKKNVKKVHLSKYDFNEMFINESSIENNNNTEIVAFNGNDNALTNYTSINNNNLYADTGSSSNNFTSLDVAFSSNLPTKVTNSYNSHNYIDENDKIKYDKQMSYHMNSINNNNTNY